MDRVDANSLWLIAINGLFEFIGKKMTRIVNIVLTCKMKKLDSKRSIGACNQFCLRKLHDLTLTRKL